MNHNSGLSQFPIERVLEAFRMHRAARESLQRLAQRGCDIGAIYALIHFYTQAEKSKLGSPVDFREISAKARSLRAGCVRLARQFVESRKVPLLGILIANLERIRPITLSLVEFAEAIDMLEVQHAPLRDRRSAPSHNVCLAIAHAEIQRCTKRHYYRDIANLVEAAYLAGGKNRDVSEEMIRKLCDRHDAGYEILKIVVRSFGEEVLNKPQIRAFFNPLRDALTQLCKEDSQKAGRDPAR